MTQLLLVTHVQAMRAPHADDGPGNLGKNWVNGKHNTESTAKRNMVWDKRNTTRGHNLRTTKSGPIYSQIAAGVEQYYPTPTAQRR